MNIDDVLGELVDHGFEDLDEDRALAVINETLSDVASRELWPTLLTTVALTFNAGSTTPTNWPDDVGTISQDGVYRLYGRGRTIPYRFLNEVREVEGTTFQPGTFWTLVGDAFYVFGSPEGNVGVDYYRVPEPVEAATAEAAIWLPKQYHRGILVNGAVYKLYLMEDDVELSKEFERLYEKAIENARYGLQLKHLEEDHIRVVNPDDWDYE